MKTAVINLKVDPALKAKAQARAKKLGVPLSYVMHTHLLNFTQGAKVEIPAETMTPHLEGLIKEVQAEIAKGEVSPAFKDSSSAIDWLKSEVSDDN